MSTAMVVSCDLESLYRLSYRYRECQKLKYTLTVKHPGIYALTYTLDIILVGNTCTISELCHDSTAAVIPRQSERCGKCIGCLQTDDCHKCEVCK